MEGSPEAASSSDDVAVALPRDDDDGGDASPASPASSAGQVDDDDAASSPASSTAAYASAARWGADTFCATARRQLRTRELRPECKQRHVNFLLLGPAGVGKSSLIHTCWRALRPSEAGGEDRDALMAALQLGWSRDDAARRAAERGKGGGLRAKHGTTRFNAYALQRRQPPGDGPIFGAGAVGLYAQDTKGHQFFDAKEQAFAARLVDGAVREGSTQERASLRYWALLSKVGLGGLLRSAEAADCPSVVVLVFDLTLRSFLKMLRASDDDPQLGCYRKIAAHAKAQGLGCLAVLTHVDVLERSKDDLPPTASPRRVGEGLDDDLGAIKKQLAGAIGGDLLPEGHIHALVNYHVHKNEPDAAVDLAALEFLAAVVDAGEAFLVKKRARGDCVVS